jgi:putative ABC transport system permease protein
METLRSWAVRFLSLFRKRRLEARLDEELRFHLEMQARENEARGMSPEAARRAARLAFSPGGSLEPLKEEVRVRRGVPALETLGRDLRYALRMMRKSPGFTVVVLLSLAFGVGANCAIFSVADALLWKPLPVPGANRLVVLGKHDGTGDDPPPWFSYTAYRHLAEARSVTTGMIAFTSQFTVQVRPAAGAGVQALPAAETATAELVSGNFFALLGGGMAAGRAFSAAEDTEPGAHPLAVLSYGFWQRTFGRDPRVVGRVLLVNGAPLAVVGVASRGFSGVFADAAPDVFLPLTVRDLVKYRGDSYTDGPRDYDAPVWQQVNMHWLQLVAVRRPGVSVEQAGAMLDVLYEREKQVQAATETEARERARLEATRIRLAPAERGLAPSRETLGAPLFILMAVAGLVLLIACANVANLLLARAGRRQKEMAVRLGIGAGRGRLLRQLLTESLLLAGLGGALGLLFAYWGSRFLLGLLASGATDNQDLVLDVAIDGRKLAFAAAVALLTAVIFGLAPALQSTRLDLAASLKEGGSALGSGERGRRGGAGLRRLPLGRLLVAVQIGLSLVLLIGAGLFVRSLRNLMGVDAGFERDRLLLVSISPHLLGYDKTRLGDLYRRLVERLEAVPAVRSASLSVYSLLGDSATRGSILLPGYTPRSGEELWTYESMVTPGYFQTVGMPLLAGRGFSVRDRQRAPRVAVVNETFVHRYLRHLAAGGAGGADRTNRAPRGPVPGGTPALSGAQPPRGALVPGGAAAVADAVGRRFGFTNSTQSHDLEIVGVVRDAKYFQLGLDGRPMVYLPVDQQPGELHDVEVRVAAGATPAVGGALRRVIAEVAPDLPVLRVATMSEQIDQSLAPQRAVARLAGFFGLLALLLAAVGLYGVMSYSVARRTNEVGLRMALGAPRAQVIGLVMRDTARLVAAGVAAGLVAAVATTRLAASQLFGLSALDPATVTAATLAMVAVALAAGFLPARRAADTDPMVALRHE